MLDKWTLSRLGFLQIYRNKRAKQRKLYVGIYLTLYLPIISAVGLFCCDKFEETPNKEVSDLSKLTKPYFSYLKYLRSKVVPFFS